MANADVFTLPHSELNPFLFASIAIEANGTTLSLISVFARLGDDPWREAARLVGLPRSDAIASLARTLAAMPASSWTQPDATAIATRLIALLPARGARVNARRTFARDPRAMRVLKAGVVALVLVLGAAYATGFLSPSHESPPFVPGGSAAALPG